MVVFMYENFTATLHFAILLLLIGFIFVFLNPTKGQSCYVWHSDKSGMTPREPHLRIKQYNKKRKFTYMKIVYLALKYIYLSIILSFWCFLLFKTDLNKINFYDFLQNLYILLVVIFTIQRFFRV